jgi:hypothetical protein
MWPVRENGSFFAAFSSDDIGSNVPCGGSALRWRTPISTLPILGLAQLGNITWRPARLDSLS